MVRKSIVILALFVGVSLGICFLAAFSNTTVLAKEVDPPTTTNPIQTDQPSQPASINTIPNDVLVHAVGSDPLVLDPAYAYDTASGEVLIQIYDPLVELTRESTDEFTPMLATGWTISPDGRTYTFNIRSGAKFHNGNDLTATDVAYTFQRGILQGGTSSPQWLFTESFFGTGIYDVCDLLSSTVCNSRSALQTYQTTHAAQVAGVCTDLTNSIVPDNANGTVTFHLNQAWGPFLHTLTGSWGSIIDREWAIQQGAWDGNCNTWQNYYAATNSTSPLRNVTNGTGPFKLHHWTSGVELVLSRHPSYWNTTPLWEGGPFGPAAFVTVTTVVVTDENTRVRMLLDGDADLISGSSISITERDDATLFHFQQPDGITPTLVHPAGTLKKYTGGLSSSATDVFFTYDIVTGGPRNYVGSGTWDGNGIPTDFFNDIHVRKGFNYAFDWDSYNNQIYGGSGIQRTGPIIKPLLGYAEGQSKFSHNQTQALAELNQAWGGLIATHGFSLTLSYNTGNLARQTVAEILKTNIEALNSRFHVNIIGLSWSDFSSDMSISRLPIFINGWQQDIPHPHNWVSPYLVGTFASRQRLPSSLSNAYQTMVNNCVGLTGEPARTCYEGIQNQTYLDALDIFLIQALQRTYISANIQGYYLNPGRVGVRYYDLYKNPLPFVVTVDPATEETLDFNPAIGMTAAVYIPVGAVAETMQIVAIPEVQAYSAPSDFILSGITFDLQAYQPDGTLIPNPAFSEAITVTISYGSGVFSPEQESELILIWWDGDQWADAACGPYGRDLVNHILEAPICHFSTFGVGEQNHPVFLPIIKR